MFRIQGSGFGVEASLREVQLTQTKLTNFLKPKSRSKTDPRPWAPPPQPEAVVVGAENFGVRDEPRCSGFMIYGLGWMAPSSFSLLSSLELSDTQKLWDLNTSPPQNSCTFLCCGWNLVVAVEAQKALLDAVLVDGVGGLELLVLLHELRVHVLQQNKVSRWVSCHCVWTRFIQFIYLDSSK